MRWSVGFSRVSALECLLWGELWPVLEKNGRLCWRFGALHERSQNSSTDTFKLSAGGPRSLRCCVRVALSPRRCVAALSPSRLCLPLLSPTCVSHFCRPDVWLAACRRSLVSREQTLTLLVVRDASRRRSWVVQGGCRADEQGKVQRAVLVIPSRLKQCHPTIMAVPVSRANRQQILLPRVEMRAPVSRTGVWPRRPPLPSRAAPRPTAP